MMRPIDAAFGVTAAGYFVIPKDWGWDMRPTLLAVGVLFGVDLLNLLLGWPRKKKKGHDPT